MRPWKSTTSTRAVRGCVALLLALLLCCCCVLWLLGCAVLLSRTRTNGTVGVRPTRLLGSVTTRSLSHAHSPTLTLTLTLMRTLFLSPRMDRARRLH